MFGATSGLSVALREYLTEFTAGDPHGMVPDGLALALG